MWSVIEEVSGTDPYRQEATILASEGANVNEVQRSGTARSTVPILSYFANAPLVPSSSLDASNRINAH